MKLARLLGAAVAAYFFVSASFLPHFAAADKAFGDPYQLNGIDPYDSPVKPILSVSRIELTLEEARANPTQAVEITIRGADKKYAPTAMHINFDERLTIVDDDGYYADRGSAIHKLEDIQYLTGDHCLGLVTAGAGNFGRDGVMWTLHFTLPDDMAEGDVYPICIEYKHPGVTNDLFTNLRNDNEGKMMEAWIFTNGIEHGYIRIKEPAMTATTTTTSTTTASTTTSTVTTSTAATTTTKRTTVTSTRPVTTTLKTTTTTAVTTTAPVTTAEPEPVYRRGDPNGDGIIDAVDSSLVLAAYSRFSTGEAFPDENWYATSDVNRDGFVDAVDASRILAYYAYVSADGKLSFEDFLRGYR
ncbi:dockerin type I domain-containing protein [Ruminococcus sp.]|uniref:dockerin type I domain-containing protein n=1 Tax=Ruminococcus sp. TaxID=41978 RepID=UPI0025E3E184|nr:dockerin type I domain-containing protein [Ruminococcus sp.]